MTEDDVYHYWGDLCFLDRVFSLGMQLLNHLAMRKPEDPTWTAHMPILRF